jgi:hypothetical protein
MKLFSDIVKLMYNGDLVGEDTIQHWYKKGSHPKGRNVFLKVRSVRCGTESVRWAIQSVTWLARTPSSTGTRRAATPRGATCSSR